MRDLYDDLQWQFNGRVTPLIIYKFETNSPFAIVRVRDRGPEVPEPRVDCEGWREVAPFRIVLLATHIYMYSTIFLWHLRCEESASDKSERYWIID